MLLTEAWTDAAPDSLRVLVHAGAESLEEARMLAGHAAACGAWGVAVMPPTFFRPDGIEGLVDWCAAVAEAADGRPFYYYHIPGLTGVHAAMAEFLPAAAERIGNLAGVKYTWEDLNDFSLTLDACGEALDVLYGRDETLLAGLVLGARGAVGSTYNFAAPLYVRLMEAMAAGEMDAARDLQRTSRQMIAAIRGVAGSFLPAAKAVMAMVGLDCGPVRPPLAALAPEQTEALREGLERLGFEAFRNR
jgi:N-acetylneuraminate lyase